jgi:hypothetical protein
MKEIQFDRIHQRNDSLPRFASNFNVTASLTQWRGQKTVVTQKLAMAHLEFYTQYTMGWVEFQSDPPPA